MPYVADDEQRRLVAKHFGGLGSPVFWAEVVRRQLSRLETLQGDFADILEHAIRDGTPIPIVGGYDARVYYPGEMALEAALLVVAMHNVTRYTRTSGLAPARSARLRPFLRALRSLAPRLEEMRNLVEHADEMAEKRDEIPFSVEFLGTDDFRGELLLRVGEDAIKLKASARAAIDLAGAIDTHIVEALGG